jgi:hypothetical protein
MSTLAFPITITLAIVLTGSNFLSYKYGEISGVKSAQDQLTDSTKLNVFYMKKMTQHDEVLHVIDSVITDKQKKTLKVALAPLYASSAPNDTTEK